MWQKIIVISISGQPSTVLIMIDQKQQDNVEYFNYLGGMVANDMRCTRKSKSRVAIRKSSVQQEDYIHE
jgi:hypothetical protein